MVLKEKIGYGVRMKDGTPGVIIAVDPAIIVYSGGDTTAFPPDAIEAGLIAFDVHVSLRDPDDPAVSPRLVGHCDSCGCEMTKGQEFCPCCGKENPHLERTVCPSCGRSYPKDMLSCPSCGSRNPSTVDMDDDEYEDEAREEYQCSYESWLGWNADREPYEEATGKTSFYGNAVKPLQFLALRNLEVVTVPGYVATIGFGAFKYCVNLSHLKLSDGIKRIGTEAFAYCGLRYLEIPRSVTFVGRGAFRNCEKLEHVVIRCPKSAVSPDAFDDCASLCEIEYAG